MAIELEIKIKLENPKQIREKILALGAKLLSKHREFDIFYDTGKDGFRKSDQVRRLRKRDKSITLTYKGPREIDDGMHRRIEVETEVKDFEKMRTILKGWDHKEGEKSEKIRETFELDGVEILIDQVAFIGWWIELEGKKEQILAVAKKIGLDTSKSEKRHYGEIFADFCEEVNCPFIGEMTFEKEKKWQQIKKAKK